MADEPQGDDTLISPQPETTPKAWYGDENKNLVETKGWASADDALKSYTELEKTFSGRVKMPTPESSAEEVRAFYQKTGCPENPEGYEIKDLPEGVVRNEEMEKWARQRLYEGGASKQLGEGIIRGFYEQNAAFLAAGRQAGEKALKEELGDKYDAEIAIAQRLCKTCSEEFQHIMVQTGLGNNPIILKEFIALGKKTLSDTLIKGEAEGNKEEGGYVPTYKGSPEMYATGEDEESKKARAYFEARGYKYQ